MNKKIIIFFSMLLMLSLGGWSVFTHAAASTASPSVNYQAQVQRKGWMSWQANGTQAGTTGKGLRLEAFRINLGNLPVGVTGGIQYRAYVQRLAWQNNGAWLASNALAGTVGQALRLEAFEIELTGELAQKYSVEYRAHVQRIGWQNWTADGDLAGTTGLALRVEAIEIKIVPKLYWNTYTQNYFYTYSNQKGDVSYPQFDYYTAARKFDTIYQNNNTYADYNNDVYDFNQSLEQVAASADEANWRARQNWQNELNKLNLTLSAAKVTLNAAIGKRNQIQSLVNQEQSYISYDKKQNLSTTADNETLKKYQENLAVANQTVTATQNTYNEDLAAVNHFKNLGTDDVSLSYNVTRSPDGKIVIVQFEETHKISGKITSESVTMTKTLVAE